VKRYSISNRPAEYEKAKKSAMMLSLSPKRVSLKKPMAGSRPEEHVIALIALRKEMIGKAGVDKMAKDYTALCKEHGIKVVIGRHMDTTKLVAMA
jgi:hypothetical protein